MLSSEGCRQRRRRFQQSLPTHDQDTLWLADPLHLRYLAGFHVDPFSLGGDFGGLLGLRSDGSTILYHDNRLPSDCLSAAVDEHIVIPWYDGQTPGGLSRRLALRSAVVQDESIRIHDSLGDPLAQTIHDTLSRLRRRKDADELTVLQQCMRAGEAGHAWAAEHVQPGMTELDVYLGVNQACSRAAGRAVIVYGDFAVSPGPQRRGGPPTQRVLAPGDLLILDFSVVLGGYRSDFTNTLCVGRQPTSEQQRLIQLCQSAMRAGEQQLRAGTACRQVYDAVHDVFAEAGLAEHFPHHAGHGLGLSHPEAPYFVREATETLEVGDVVTLEPGLYVEGVGGIRIEHNYRITENGLERLSRHDIGLVLK